MDLEAALAGRRSIRSYRAEPVPEQVLEHLIQCAVLVGSPGTELEFAL